MMKNYSNKTCETERPGNHGNSYVAGGDRYLLCYDISAPKRLKKMEKLLSGFAFRIQKSVYFAILTEDVLEKKLKISSNLVDKKEDDFRCYKLPLGEVAICFTPDKDVAENNSTDNDHEGANSKGVWCSGLSDLKEVAFHK